MHLQGFRPKQCISSVLGPKKNCASSRLLAKNRVSQVFWDPNSGRGRVSQGLAVSKIPKICIKKYVPEATKAARQMVKKNIGALNILQLSSSDQKDRLNCFDKTHQYLYFAVTELKKYFMWFMLLGNSF